MLKRMLLNYDGMLRFRERLLQDLVIQHINCKYEADGCCNSIPVSRMEKNQAHGAS